MKYALLVVMFILTGLAEAKVRNLTKARQWTTLVAVAQFAFWQLLAYGVFLGLVSLWVYTEGGSVTDNLDRRELLILLAIFGGLVLMRSGKFYKDIRKGQLGRNGS